MTESLCAELGCGKPEGNFIHQAKAWSPFGLYHPFRRKSAESALPDPENAKPLITGQVLDATERITAHAKRGKGITLSKEETKILAIMLEDLYSEDEED